MVGILAQGRLGNQMFQYAFIYAVSKKLDVPFFMVNPNSLHYFKLYEDLEQKNKKYIFKFALQNLLKKSSIKVSRKTIKMPIKWIKDWAIHKNTYTWQNTTNETRFLLTEFKDNVLYNGFFQSEDYFTHLKKEIFNLFEIKFKYQKQFNDNKKHIFNKKVIAIHIRRTDFKFFGGLEMGGLNVMLPVQYYQKCLDLIDDVETYHVVFISDDINFVKNEFSQKNNYFFENNDEITDFQFLLNSDVLIIANSTFSWWAAWLNQKQDKIVFAPNYFLGFKVHKYYPAGINVSNWQWINVE